MLDYLGHHNELPVPKVIHAADNLLLLEHIETSGPLNEHAERHAAELLAKLHGIRGRRFGLKRDTLIGPVTQPNRQLSEWLEFFRDRRLLHMAGEALAAARIDAAMMRRVEHLAGRLDRWIEEPAFPALIHGDMWGGNVLVRGGRIAAFVDPSIYYADPEIELAFGTLFGTFGADFFARYGEIRPLSPGFFEARRDIYNLYPLLVHSRLFGGAYPGAIDRILSRFGC